MNHDAHEDIHLRPSQHPVVLMVAIVVVTLIFFFIVGLIGYFQMMQREAFEQDAQAQPNTLRQMRAREDQLLNRYAYIDREKGLVRIPIERAIELEAERSWRRTGARANGVAGGTVEQAR